MPIATYGCACFLAQQPCEHERDHNRTMEYSDTPKQCRVGCHRRLHALKEADRCCKICRVAGVCWNDFPAGLSWWALALLIEYAEMCDGTCPSGTTCVYGDCIATQVRSWTVRRTPCLTSYALSSRVSWTSTEMPASYAHPSYLALPARSAGCPSQASPALAFARQCAPSIPMMSPSLLQCLQTARLVLDYKRSSTPNG